MPRTPAFFPKMKERGVSRRRNRNGGWEYFPGCGLTLMNLGCTTAQVDQALAQVREDFKHVGTTSTN